METEKFNSYDRDNKRATQIRQAAYDLIFEMPYADITMTMIAQRAQVAKGTIFNYFRSKEDIFMAITLSGYLRYSELVETALEEVVLKNKADVKAFFIIQTKLMVEEFSVIIWFNSLRRFTLEVHADPQQTECGRARIYEVHKRIGIIINTQVPAISVESIIHAFMIQSAILNGIINLGNMEKFRDEMFDTAMPGYQIDSYQETSHLFGLYLDDIL